MLHAQPGQRRFELERLVDRLADERLDRVLAPRAERPRPNPPPNPLTPAKPTPLISTASPSSTWTPPAQRISLTASCWPDSKSWLPSTATIGHPHDASSRDQDVRLLGQAVVGQVAAQHQDVGLLGHGGEDRLEHALRVLRAVDVADGCQPYYLVHIFTCLRAGQIATVIAGRRAGPPVRAWGGRVRRGTREERMHSPCQPDARSRAGWQRGVRASAAVRAWVTRRRPAGCRRVGPCSCWVVRDCRWRPSFG